MAEEKLAVIDLGGTLVSDELKWRPGAKELLGELIGKGVTPVVWTNVSSRTVRDITANLDGFYSLVNQVFTKDESSALLTGLARQMVESGDPEKIALGKKIRPNSLAKIPAAVGSRILVDDDYTLRAEAREFGAIVIDPTPTDEDTSPDQWAKRVAAAILSSV